MEIVSKAVIALGTNGISFHDNHFEYFGLVTYILTYYIHITSSNYVVQCMPPRTSPHAAISVGRQVHFDLALLTKHGKD